MDKNSIIGIVLVGVILFGFSWYQSNQFEKQREAQAQLDSIAAVQRVEMMQQMALDSLRAVENGSSSAQSGPAAPALPVAYKDSALSAAATASSDKYTLSNDLLEIVIDSRGAQPYSVRVKDFQAYGGDSLYIMKPGSSDYAVRIYAGELISTADFSFGVVEATDSCLVLRLPFAGGGYIQQKYTLPQGSYMMYNELSFCNMGGVIARNVSLFDIDWSLTVPRMEKGYKNEKQYSKLDVYLPGDKKPEVVGKGGRDGSKTYSTKVDWFDFNQQFFSAMMTAPAQFSSGEFSLQFCPENDPDKNLMNCKASLRNDFAMQDGNAAYNYEFYFGPNNYYTLRSYGRKYEKIITIGGEVIGLITRFVIIPLFNWLSRFIHSYGIIILIMTVLLKLVISPLTVKSYLSSAKMNAIKPEIDKLNAKYPKANTDQKEALKKQQATMDLYKKAGIKPLGGCLPMLLTFPILWAMFRFFPVSIELRQQPFLWAEDLSAYDSILDFGFRILGMDHLSLFALLMAVSMFFYSKMTMPKSDDPQMAPMRFMSVWLMPIMMFFICNSLSSGLSYYYLLSNLLTMVQTFVIKKWVVKPEKLIAQIQNAKSKPVQKSKWQLRLEEAQKMAAQQQKAQGGRK